MKIAFTGGGSGGHFYPIVAIAEAIHEEVRARHLVEPKLIYLAPEPFDTQALFANGIQFRRIPAGKIRRYFSLQNFFDPFITLFGFLYALVLLLFMYPDVLISKGGFGSVPTVLAAAILRIPIIVHESDATPGRANRLGARFAKRIAITFDETINEFPERVRAHIARTGIPIRKELAHLETEGARQYLALEAGIPTILILGGSLGAQKINETVISGLPDLISFANVIHQTGQKLFKETEGTAKVMLEGNPHASRYHVFSFLDELSLRRAAGVSDLIVSRAGSGTISEIALWKKAAILIPIPEVVSHDQRQNAYGYARTGAAVVLEEANMTPHLLASEARRISTDPELRKRMGDKGASFADPDAAKLLAREALGIALSHEA